MNTKIVYITQCFTGMTEDDVWDYVSKNQYEDWTFDDLTGGKDEFYFHDSYNRLSSRFKALKERK